MCVHIFYTCNFGVCSVEVKRYMYVHTYIMCISVVSCASIVSSEITGLCAVIP